MAYEMQIRIVEHKRTPQGTSYIERGFKSVKPSGYNVGPYQFSTAEEAQNMLDMCYPNVIAEDKRVVQIHSGYHHENMVVSDIPLNS